MPPLRLVLLADGARDRVLMPILIWTLRSVMPSARFFGPEFEVRREGIGPAIQRVSRALRPDILFVHRDSERESLRDRLSEIPKADGVVRVVPVRMTEAWLLIDEMAIRRAAGNPNGRVRIELPKVARLEDLPDPKGMLRRLLLEASEFTSPRRRQRFQRDINRCTHLVAEYTEDFSPLRGLAAYRAFETELQQALDDVA